MEVLAEAVNAVKQCKPPRKGLNTFAYRPHAGEARMARRMARSSLGVWRAWHAALQAFRLPSQAGEVHHLDTAFLLADGLSTQGMSVLSVGSDRCSLRLLRS